MRTPCPAVSVAGLPIDLRIRLAPIDIKAQRKLPTHGFLSDSASRFVFGISFRKDNQIRIFAVTLKSRHLKSHTVNFNEETGRAFVSAGHREDAFLFPSPDRPHGDTHAFGRSCAA